LVAPLAARAQSQTFARRVGVLSGGSSGDLELRSAIGALESGLRELGWTNLQILARYAERDPARLRPAAKDLMGYQPEVIVAATKNEVSVLRDLMPSIPIVFTQIPDPVEAGLVSSFGRPSDNVTGVAAFDPSLCDGSLRAILACAPHVARVAVAFDPTDPSWPAYARAIEASARNLRLTWSPVGAQDAAELTRTVGEFARQPNGALFVLPSLTARDYRDLLIELAARYRLPAIYPRADFASSGGLMSYGINVPHLYRDAAAYVDRLLKGARTIDLPPGRPGRFDFVINRQTAKTLGLEIPRLLLQRADLVIS
jgi:putative ABC transport system substrate-binding protein